MRGTQLVAATGAVTSGCTLAATGCLCSREQPRCFCPCFGAASPQARRAWPGALARAYPDLRGAWRLALAPRSGDAWPWRAALRSTATPAWVNGANLRLPTLQGLTTVEVIVPPIGDMVRVALMRDGRVEGPVREVAIR